jgi:C4-dicarboxylate-specific signal transduction histidine kinase
MGRMHEGITWLNLRADGWRATSLLTCEPGNHRHAEAVKWQTARMPDPSIAHELTQPLAGIMININTCLRTLARDPPNLDGARAAARRALRDVERAHDLVTRLRAAVAKKEVTSESLQLNDVIREVVASLSSELQKRAPSRLSLGSPE